MLTKVVYILFLRVCFGQLETMEQKVTECLERQVKSKEEFETKFKHLEVIMARVSNDINSIKEVTKAHPQLDEKVAELDEQLRMYSETANDYIRQYGEDIKNLNERLNQYDNSVPNNYDVDNLEENDQYRNDSNMTEYFQAMFDNMTEKFLKQESQISKINEMLEQLLQPQMDTFEEKMNNYSSIIEANVGKLEYHSNKIMDMEQLLKVKTSVLIMKIQQQLEVLKARNDKLIEQYGEFITESETNSRLYNETSQVLETLNDTINENVREMERQNAEIFKLKELLNEQKETHVSDVASLQEAIQDSNIRLNEELANIEEQMLHEVVNNVGPSFAQRSCGADQNVKIMNISFLSETLFSPKQDNFYRDCSDALSHRDTTHQIYTIQPKEIPFIVVCDSVTLGGGWTIIQNRFSEQLEFNLTWYNYRRGFGSMFVDHWLGLDYVYDLVDSGNHELIIQIADSNQNEYYSVYDEFIIGTEKEKFKLKSIGRYEGSAGDLLYGLQGSYFYTYDHKDKYGCALALGAGWWFNDCTCAYFNANGVYSNVTGINTSGSPSVNDKMNIVAARMMVRRKEDDIYEAF